MEVVPLTPTVVDCVTFDRAPLGRRGYNEDQVDDFLDRVQATLLGKDNLTAQQVRDVEFDPANLIRRGYHEDQVDEFLDVVAEELDRREGNPPRRLPPRAGGGAAPQGTPAPPGAPGSQETPGLAGIPGLSEAPGSPGTSGSAGTPGLSGVPGLQRSPGVSETPGSAAWPTPPITEAPAPSAAEQTMPMFARPPSPAVPSVASGPPKSSVPAAPDKAASPNGAPATGTPKTPADATVVIASITPPAAAPTTIEPATTPPAADEASAAEADTEDAQAVPGEAPETVDEPEAAAEPLVNQATTQRGNRAQAATAWEPPGQDAWRDSDHLALPLPPAPPGERGYRPGDVERLMKLLAATLDSPGAPDPNTVANLKLTRTFFVGQGYHTGVVDAVRQAWLDELNRRAL